MMTTAKRFRREMRFWSIVCVESVKYFSCRHRSFRSMSRANSVRTELHWHESRASAGPRYRMSSTAGPVAQGRVGQWTINVNSLRPSHLPRRSRARHKAARRRRPPGLMGLGLRRARGSRRRRFGLGWLLSRFLHFLGGLGPRLGGLRFVLRQTAMLVLLARTAMARLISAGSLRT